MTFDQSLRRRQAAELAALLRAEQTAGRGPSLGERFTAGAAYRRARDTGVFRAPGPLDGEVADNLGGRLMSTRDLMGALRLRAFTDLSPFSVQGVPFVGLNPLPATVPGLVETIPADDVIVELADELADQVAASGVPVGSPLPEAVFNAGATPTGQQLPRFGLAWPVTKSVLDRPGEVQALLERRLDLGFTFGLEGAILAGTAGGLNGPGVVNATGTHQIAFADAGHSSEYRHDALARGVAAVAGAGWYVRPVQVVIAPDALERVSTERSSGSGDYLGDVALPTVDGWFPSLALPPGTAVVGDFFDAVALFLHGGLDVAVSAAHADVFTRSMVEMALECRAYAWVRRPDALAVVTGL